MKQFEKITQNVNTLVEFLKTDVKGGNKGCAECGHLEGCNGAETCEKVWKEFLNSEA
jgi:hypothetical protein